MARPLRISYPGAFYQGFVIVLVDQTYASPLEAVSGSTLLGSADFISFVKATYLSRRKPDKNLPALKQLAEGVSIQTICAEVEAAFTGQSRLARSIQMYLFQKYGRMKLKDIGAYFGVGESAVCQAARRVTGRTKMDRRLKKDRRDGKTFQIVNNEDLTLYLFYISSIGFFSQ